MDLNQRSPRYELRQLQPLVPLLNKAICCCGTVNKTSDCAVLSLVALYASSDSVHPGHPAVMHSQQELDSFWDFLKISSHLRLVRRDAPHA